MNAEAHTQSYYAATAKGLRDWPALKGEQRADVCVIGGGFTGVSIALYLAERGYDVVLLEAKRIGWGASGRNGGQICSGYSADMSAIQNSVGRDDARKLFAMAEEAKEIIRERVTRHEIDCDLKWGYLDAAVKPRQLKAMAAKKETWERDFGYPGLELLRNREDLSRYVNSQAYVGGLYDPGGGQLHPLNYCLGLAAAAVAAGARIHEGSPVETITQGTEPSLSTPQGQVKAKFLVFCCNAYLDDLVPAVAKKIMPIANYIGATEGLGENRARDLIPSDAAVCDWNFILNYYRISADHRLLFGGLASYSTLTPPNLKRGLRREMEAVFPSLDDVNLDFVWGGLVGITIERTPHLGRIGSNLYFAQGFSGTGVALTGMAGKVIAEAIAGQAERFDIFARLPHSTFPGGKLFGMPSLVLAMTWYRLRDLLP